MRGTRLRLPMTIKVRGTEALVSLHNEDENEDEGEKEGEAEGEESIEGQLSLCAIEGKLTLVA